MSAFARLIAGLALVGSIFLPAGVHAQAASAFPFTITDDAGVSTTFTGPPQRIVSLSPGETETVFALGAGNRLVAVDSYSDYPPQAASIQPRLDTYPTPSVETIVSLKPDLVISLVESNDVLAQLRQQGIPTLKFLPRDFAAATTEIAELGHILGETDQGQTLATDMTSRRDAVVQAVADAPRPRVFYELDASDTTKPFAAGPNGFYGQLVDLAGGDNIFGDLPTDFAQVSAESVISRNPDLIVLADAYSPYNPQSVATVATRPGWDTTTAVQNAAIYAIQADLLSRPGPRLIDGLENLAFLLHPDRFASSGGPRPSTSDLPSPYCAAGQVPEFAFGFGALSDALGDTMGTPTECAHVSPVDGDTYQQTAKGLAIYRKATNLPLFTSGMDHWALTAQGLQQWTGEGLDPPAGS